MEPYEFLNRVWIFTASSYLAQLDERLALHSSLQRLLSGVRKSRHPRGTSSLHKTLLSFAHSRNSLARFNIGALIVTNKYYFGGSSLLLLEYNGLRSLSYLSPQATTPLDPQRPPPLYVWHGKTEGP